MVKKILNVTNGELTIAKDFVVSNSTALGDLEHKFANQLVKDESYKVKDYSRFHLKKIKIDEVVFDFEVYLHKNTVCSVDIKPITVHIEMFNKPICTDWDTYSLEEEAEYRSKWLAEQVGDNTKYVWKMDFSGRIPETYEFKYGWGKIGVYAYIDQGGPNCYCSLSFK